MREDVQKIYDENKSVYDEFFDLYDETDDQRRFYVYEWYIVESNKVFYVGKGTGDRYKHIIEEIRRYEKNNRKYKGKRYKYLNDEFTIDHRIIMDGLTDIESQIVEFHFIIQRLLEFQPLLQNIIPWERGGLTDEHYDRWLEVNYCKDTIEFLNYFR